MVAWLLLNRVEPLRVCSLLLLWECIQELKGSRIACIWTHLPGMETGLLCWRICEEISPPPHVQDSMVLHLLPARPYQTTFLLRPIQQSPWSTAGKDTVLLQPKGRGVFSAISLTSVLE